MPTMAADKYFIVFCAVLSLTTISLASAGTKDFSSAVEIFSSRFYKEVASGNRDKNIITSPLSADVVMTMVGLGASGQTKEEIEKSLAVEKLDDVVLSIKAFIEDVENVEGAELKLANKVFPKQLAGGKVDSVNATYRSQAEDIFKSSVESIDFSRNSEAAKTINDWVESKTNHLIKNIIDPTSLDALTQAVLVNAIYFKSNWANSFNKDNTKKEDFNLADGTVVKMDMMNLNSEFWYQESPELDAKIVVLPYRNRKITMVVILPNKIDGLDSLEDKLLNGTTQYLNNMKRLNVILSLPKFTIETTTDVKEVLVKLGCKRVFGNTAELPGILNGVPDLYVSQAIQKAFIEVNEQGSEAAATTAVNIRARSGKRPRQLDVVHFKANHPFYFAILKSGTVLFTGNKRV